MAKTLVVNETNPNIMIELTERTESEATEYRGECTQCGHEVSQFAEELAVVDAKVHIDRHDGEE